ncbi:NAD(P)/FAD-dependent oxidoreductase [Patescibacteria group bacterium]|nr:NAD(P)/FAD-dependent oxidoreductase [Patescibacteria group bacterium]
MSNYSVDKKIIIVGGGFGGIRCALDLAKKKLRKVKIILINNKSNFEYTPALCRLVTGYSPLGISIPLQKIFKNKNIEFVKDQIIQINLSEKKLYGNSDSRYPFDMLVLALGSETNFFDIPGIQKLSFKFKSINEALRLKRHLHEIFTACKKKKLKAKLCTAHLVIIGGGATGVELASELIGYSKKLAKAHQFDPALITVDLIEAGNRLLPNLPLNFAKKIEKNLKKLGVNILLNKIVLKEEAEKVLIKDMEMKTKTVIWAAGVKGNHLFLEIKGLDCNKQGRVLVNQYLQPDKFENVFILGDGADTDYSGMAQTAIYDGRYVAKNILKKLGNKTILPYQVRKPFYVISLGSNWVAASIGNLKVYGKIGWWLRRLADLRFFLSILPFKNAILAWREGKKLWEICPICSFKKVKL